jgi:hypothetical protein
MPARHTSPSGRFASPKADFERAALVDQEGVGETSGQRPDRSFEKNFLFENRSGRRNRFSSFGADLWVRNFSGLKGRLASSLPASSLRFPGTRLKSDPDVFADALVPARRRWPPAKFDPPSQRLIIRRSPRGLQRQVRLTGDVAAMVILCRSGTVNRIPGLR